MSDVVKPGPVACEGFCNCSSPCALLDKHHGGHNCAACVPKPTRADRIVAAARGLIGMAVISEDESAKLLHTLCKEMLEGVQRQRRNEIKPGAHLVGLRDAIKRGGPWVETSIGHLFLLLMGELSLSTLGEVYAEQDDPWAWHRRNKAVKETYIAYVEAKKAAMKVPKSEWKDD